MRRYRGLNHAQEDRAPRRHQVRSRALLTVLALSTVFVFFAITSSAVLAAEGVQTAPAATAAAAHPTHRTAAYVCASDLELALRATSADLASRGADVARREGELRLAELGISTVLSMSTDLEVGANLLRDAQAQWSTGLQVDASIGYRYDDVAIVRAQTALTTAQRRQADQQRADVLNALVNLSRLRAAERLVVQTDASASEAETLAESVRRSAAAAHAATGEPDDPAAAAELAPDLALNIRELDLAAAKARAAAAGRGQDMAEAHAELNRLGLEPVTAAAGGLPARQPGPVACLPAGEVPLSRAAGPTLPQPTLLGSFDRALLQHAVDLAAAQHRRAALAPLRDLSMTAHYQEGGARVLAEVELDGGRPAAGVNLRLREAAAQNWGVGVSARIRLDDTMGAALAAAAAQEQTARTALSEFDAAFPTRVAAEVATVGSAWLQLAFAAEAVGIARERARLALDDREAARAEQVLGRAVEALEREYQAYLRVLGRYLAAFDLPWSSLTPP